MIVCMSNSVSLEIRIFLSCLKTALSCFSWDKNTDIKASLSSRKNFWVPPILQEPVTLEF